MRSRREYQHGLTLIELLVVVVILALASSVVLLNAPPARPAVRDDAERFAARMRLALDEAIATGAVMRVSIDATGYGFETLVDGEWTAIEDDPVLARRNFNVSSLAIVEVKDAANENARALGGGDRRQSQEEDNAETHAVALDPLAAQTAFDVRFSSARGKWTVSVSEAGAVEVKRDG